MKIHSWRAWYPDGTVREGPNQKWEDGADKVFITFEDGAWLAASGRLIKDGAINFNVEFPTGPRVVELKFADGLGFVER